MRTTCRRTPTKQAFFLLYRGAVNQFFAQNMTLRDTKIQTV
jgi:hypothetical protein